MNVDLEKVRQKMVTIITEGLIEHWDYYNLPADLEYLGLFPMVPTLCDSDDRWTLYHTRSRSDEWEGRQPLVLNFPTGYESVFIGKSNSICSDEAEKNIASILEEAINRAKNKLGEKKK